MNLWVNLVDTLPNVKYWSEVFMLYQLDISSIEVKVTDFEILFYKCLVKVFKSLYRLKL